MAKTVFIADLHLDKSKPEITQLFLQFIDELNKDNQHQNSKIDALYILGDFFEYWLGDDHQNKLTHTVKKALKNLQQQTPIYFIHGNRDFLIGHDFAKSCGMDILPEHHLIDLYGKKTLIMHGDTLCTDDTEYINFRQKVRTAKWQHKILSLPIFIRKLIAWRMRWKSKKANHRKTDYIMDVNQTTVESMMKKHQVKQLIHGHTHRPNKHEFLINGELAQRFVVSDWHKKAIIVEAINGKIDLVNIVLNKGY